MTEEEIRGFFERFVLVWSGNENLLPQIMEERNGVGLYINASACANWRDFDAASCSAINAYCYRTNAEGKYMKIPEALPHIAKEPAYRLAFGSYAGREVWLNVLAASTEQEYLKLKSEAERDYAASYTQWQHCQYQPSKADKLRMDLLERFGLN